MRWIIPCSSSTLANSERTHYRLNSKYEILNTKQIINIQNTNSKPNHGYDLEERCLRFAQRGNAYVRALPRTVTNFENGKQLARSTGSVGANYIEANESLSKKDFIMRVKISKKETKESRFWLVLTEPSPAQEQEKAWLIDECNQLMKIFGAILEKSK